MTSGGTAKFNVTRIGAGQYCITTTPAILSNWSPLIASLQGSPGFISANTSTGSVCNPVSGGYGVFTYSPSGVASDRVFTVMMP